MTILMRMVLFFEHWKKKWTLSKSLVTITMNVDNLQGSLRKTIKDTNLCLSQIEQMQWKCSDLEDRSRRNNVRLVNLPTGIEGDDPVGFLQKMLPKWIPELSARPCPIEIDRAPWVYSNYNSPKPRLMVFRLLRYPDRQAILQGARKAKPTLPGGTSLEFYADYSPETVQRRKAFSAIRAKLQQKGAETFLIYPAILRVTYKGQKHSFESPEDPDKYIEGLDGATVPSARRSLNLQFQEQMEESVYKKTQKKTCDFLLTNLCYTWTKDVFSSHPCYNSPKWSGN